MENNEIKKLNDFGSDLSDLYRVMELYQGNIDALSLIRRSDKFEIQYFINLVDQFLDTQFHYNQKIMKDLDDIAAYLMNVGEE
ncbi:hypothetical protein [Facklamia sp. P12955]|uniref:hypothetical protein n=1 Tax=Facklamia sp. P12955 TaxID=3421946 RepID=UPI003D178E5B